MATVYDYARALAKSLRECDEHKQMRSLASRVRKDSKLEGLLSEFRLRQLELQALQMQGQQPSKEQMERFGKLVKTVEAQQTLREYLTAENAYGQVLVEVQKVLEEVFDPDVPGPIKTGK